MHRSGAGSGAAGRVLARLPADRTARHTYTRQSVSYFTVPPRAHPSTDTHPHSPIMRHFKSNIRFPVAASERAVWIMMAGFTHGPLRRSTKIAHFIDRCRNHASRSVAELASYGANYRYSYLKLNLLRSTFDMTFDRTEIS